MCGPWGHRHKYNCPSPCHLVPSSRVRLLVIIMIIFIQVSRSLATPHSSVSVQFVTALMSSSHRARGLPLFLVPSPILNIIDFSKLFSLRMICPKYDSWLYISGWSKDQVVGVPISSLSFIVTFVLAHTIVVAFVS